MATYTPNYNLSKPEANDDFDAFRASYGDNMDKIDNNMGGGGGVEGGAVYGAFLNPNRMIYSAFTYDEEPHDWVAPEDCILTDNLIPPNQNKACFLQIDGKQVQASYSTIDNPFVYVRKGQTVTYRAKNGSAMKAYGLIQGTNEIFAPVIYSDIEREIGVWRDNKPLYAKTVHVSPLPSSASSAQYAHNIANIDKICHYEGIAMASSGSSVIMNRVGMGGNTLNASTSYDLYVNKTYITVAVGQDRSSIEAYVTIWYTKTTDVAGSGSWTTSGVPSVHYSTNEQVIGTWVDGKPLYEKTISCGALPNNTTKNVAHSISDIEYAVIIQGSARNPNNGIEIPLPYVYGNTRCLQTYIDSTNIKLISTENMSAYTQSYVTIRYTKTTD